MSKKKTRGPP